MQLFASLTGCVVACAVLLCAISCAAQASMNASMITIASTNSLVPVLAMVNPDGSFRNLYEWKDSASIYDRAIAKVSNNTVIALISTFEDDPSDPFAAQSQLYILSNASSLYWKPISVWNISDVNASIGGVQYNAGLIYVLLVHSKYPAQPVYEIIVANDATGAIKSVRNFSLNAQGSGPFGLAYTPSTGWLTTFFSFWNGTNPNDDSLLIWNYNPSTGKEVVQEPSTNWYANGWAFSPALQKLVAIGGVDVNYGNMDIITYTPPAAAPTIVCPLPSNLPPGLFCLSQSWLGTSGTDIYMVDCYYTRLLHFDLKCNLLAQVPLTQTIGDVSVLNSPIALF